MVAEIVKESGEAKEVRESRASAVPLFDVHGYGDDFNRAIVPAYKRGIADAELPADAGVARSIIPPGTAAVRDFSHLAPQIPELDAARCVGCMTCVSACPDSAIMGIALPETQLDGLVSTFAATQPDPGPAGGTARGRFARTTKYADLPARRELGPAGVGVFVGPVHCKGCGERSEERRVGKESRSRWSP